MFGLKYFFLTPGLFLPGITRFGHSKPGKFIFPAPVPQA
jgi:hypothetical protein